MANNPTLRTPESYLDEVAREKGYDSFQDPVEGIAIHMVNGKDVFEIIQEAMRRYKDAACEAQRQLCAESLHSSLRIQVEEYILNAPTPE